MAINVITGRVYSKMEEIQFPNFKSVKYGKGLVIMVLVSFFYNIITWSEKRQPIQNRTQFSHKQKAQFTKHQVFVTNTAAKER